jgi:hypothetical protein
MVYHYIETFFYIIISQSTNITYFAMIMSMYQNAGIISIFYPISVFGYAMLEETHPSRDYWSIVRKYTVFILLLKFCLNINGFNNWYENKLFTYYSGYFKFGVYEYKTFNELFLYMMPEILIINFIMLNEIKMKLIGLFY